ncbi:23383_t:CDS:2, partial [Entrophospora sp. SA101]
SDSNENSDVSNTSNNESDNLIPSPLLDYSPTTENFRDYYMSQLTNGFGEDLDKIRKEQNLDSNRLESNAANILPVLPQMSQQPPPSMQPPPQILPPPFPH